MAHIPVLLNEVLQYLDPKPGENFIDCTVGEGGHALAILKLTAPEGRVLGIDRDADMVGRLQERAEAMRVGNRFTIRHGNFADMATIATEESFSSVDGILFDFGLSSWQLEESGAGFSFQNIEPLDMRFDRAQSNSNYSETAASIVNSWPEESIARILYEFGEERYSRRIAKEIVQARKRERIITTDQLVGIISSAIPRKKSGIHFATRTFQALRIAVNSELENVEKGLHEAINLLSPGGTSPRRSGLRPREGGRIAAISFHSLEDRRVKNIFREYEGGPPSPKDSEGKRSPSGFLKIITKKPITPSPEEIRENPRARSAKLRVAERI